MKRNKFTKKHRTDRPQKFVRVDPRTVLEVDASIPDQDVKERFALKQLQNLKSPIIPQKGIDFFR